MKKTNSFLLLGSLLVLGLTVHSGCSDSGATTIDPAVLANLQADRVLTEQPADPVGIIELMTELAGDSANPKTVSTDAVPVALLGQIGAADAATPVFIDGQAAFAMVDPSYEPPTAEAEHGHEHEGDHDHGEEAQETQGAVADTTAVADTAKSGHKEDCPCPFCSSSKETPPQANVTFIGEDGEPLPAGAALLFGLNEGEIVVVTGTAKLSIGQLQVTADKIHVRK